MAERNKDVAEKKKKNNQSSTKKKKEEGEEKWLDVYVYIYNTIEERQLTITHIRDS